MSKTEPIYGDPQSRAADAISKYLLWPARNNSLRGDITYLETTYSTMQDPPEKDRSHPAVQD